MKVPTLGSRQSMGISSEGSFIGLGHPGFSLARGEVFRIRLKHVGSRKTPSKKNQKNTALGGGPSI